MTLLTQNHPQTINYTYPGSKQLLFFINQTTEDFGFVGEVWVKLSQRQKMNFSIQNCTENIQPKKGAKCPKRMGAKRLICEGDETWQVQTLLQYYD